MGVIVDENKLFRDIGRIESTLEAVTASLKNLDEKLDKKASSGRLTRLEVAVYSTLAGALAWLASHFATVVVG